MNDFRYTIPYFKLSFTTLRIFLNISLLISFLFTGHMAISQSLDPATCIKDLEKGTLIIRIPTNKTKIDTLTAMVSRSKDPKSKERLEKELNQTIEERDSLFADYIYAFNNSFDYCKVGYIFDYDARDLNTASYYNLESEEISVADLSDKPLYYLYFERTTDSKIDALVMYNRNLQKIPNPFPNDFSRGGLNTIFLKLSGNSFAVWRVERINKQLHRYLEQVKAYEYYENKE